MTIYTANNGLLGGTGDILLEVGTENWSSGEWVPSAPQCSVGPGPSVRFDFTVSGADAHIATGINGNNGYVVYLDVFGETLGGETAIISHPRLGYRPLRLGPDGKLYVYDSLGNLLGSSISSVDNVWREVVLVEDGTGQERTVYLYIDRVVEMAAVSNNMVFADMTNIRSATGWGWGDKLQAGQSTGTVYLLRNALFRSFGSASESPRSVQWPALRASPRRVPTSEGDLVQWLNGTTSSPNTWRDVDEFPNDGDDTKIQIISSSGIEFHEFLSGEPNPLPVGANVLGVQVSCSALALYFMYLNIHPPSSYYYSMRMYVGATWRGLSWLFIPGNLYRETFNPGIFQFGVRADQTNFSICSNICYQVVYWTDLLPLATIPSPPSVKRHYSFIY